MGFRLQEKMILNNLYQVFKGDIINLALHKEKIEEISMNPILSKGKDLLFEFENSFIFPGIINSHDHLDFNLFPMLGGNQYKSYQEWGPAIRKESEGIIKEILKIPIELREKWGLYKNLLSGVTTVMNHGKRIKTEFRPIKLLENCESLHSIQFENNWLFKINNPFKQTIPVVIHIGEGIDKKSSYEIDKLIRGNLFNRGIIGVHGLAMKVNQSIGFKGLIWCPYSNFFLFNETARVDQIKSFIPILFGTDSTLTSDWNLWEHIRMARATHLLSDKELFDTLNLNPARLWKLNSGEIKSGKDGDLIIAKIKPGLTGEESFFALNPEDLQLILVKGEIKLIASEIFDNLTSLSKQKFSPIQINNRLKYIIGDLPDLILKLKKIGSAIRLPPELIL